MAPKKKGKVNKLARMSEEEKLRYLQHRAAVEEEAKRRKEHIISSYMKNKLKREEAFTRLNTAKINQQWRQTLRQIKNKELHDATETLRQVFEIALKTKNKIIENLITDLDSSIKLHNLAVKTHLIAIDKILGIRMGRMETISLNYSNSHIQKMAQATSERDRLESTFDEDKDKLQTMIHWEEVCNNEKNKNLKKKSLNYKNDIMHQLMSETREFEIQGKLQMKDMKKEVQNVVGEYHKKFAPFKAHYNELLENDKISINNYKENCKIIEDHKKMITKVKKEIEANEKTNQSEIKRLELEIKEVKMEYINIKKEFGKKENEFQNMLNHLSIHSNSTINYFKDLEKVVDSINHYLDLCKRYMYSHEHNVPMASTAVQCDEVPLIELTHFWKIFGELQVEVTNLEAFYSNYLEENNYLKRLVEQYMNTVARPNTVPSMPRTSQEMPKVRAKSSSKLYRSSVTPTFT
ncbi:coiled-coil domain-containing protein 65 [Cimex lectularius]|uniref:Dynein regulatory complex subunit 2 n=1 Tax=Cimex lectularius TaxID=79782 RepID=A0A8I6TII1_CIMLE|nr:coiled-coil domain-containing protein 65 [Cimex lectularius]XP_024080979.1 coiled-coil domain-containing protein 65 [Cimex lectularius]